VEKSKNILVTGSAGFIGYHLSKRLLEDGNRVVGIDNLNDYYDVNLKKARLEKLTSFSGFNFHKIDLAEKNELKDILSDSSVDYIIHLAAQAGVRYSLENPDAYIKSNIEGFHNIINLANLMGVMHFIYASSSSVYGANKKIPFSVHDNVDHPVSLYAATKKSNELIAHTYSHLYKLPTTGLRFFTVYGPYGRPDMALFLFTKAILEDQPIRVFNHGRMSRDFTYIDDIIESIVRLIPKPPVGNAAWDGQSPDPASSFSPYQVFNIGNNSPVLLEDFIGIIEKELGKKANKTYEDIQPGDVEKTYADVQSLFEYVNFKPKTPLDEGVKQFVKWYKEYYKV
jgi:UDP-glucuronate 4-epimerase